MNISLGVFTFGIKPQNVKEPSELFSEMVEVGQLSPDNLYLLDSALFFAGRQDLIKQLEGELKILLEQLCTQQYSSYVKSAHNIHCLLLLTF